MKKINIVIFNGGRGSKSLIKESLKYNNLNIISIINPYDDGKSTGELRKFFNIHGPSDFRKIHQLYLNKKTPKHKFLKKIFKYRFNKNIKKDKALMILDKIILNQYLKFSSKDYKFINKFYNLIVIFLKSIDEAENKLKENFNYSDCSLINLIYAASLIKFKNNINKSLKYLESLFDIPNSAISITNMNRYLSGIRDSNEFLYNEAEIVELRSNVRIKELFLTKKPLTKNFKTLSYKNQLKRMNKLHSLPSLSILAKETIIKSNIIIYASGTQHSSLFPTYMTKNLNIIIKKSLALKIFITNIGADYETPNYKASEYILYAENYFNKGLKSFTLDNYFDLNLINSSKYQKNFSYVKTDKNKINKTNIPFIIDNFESKSTNGTHNGKKLLKLILNYYK
jgi:2-phospho-L-lactate transferase/gluconeogenesis factor (CofD/UPF0052 family)